MYSVAITRERPTAFVLLVDQSMSMSERIDFGGCETTKAAAVSHVGSAFVDELMFRARREGGVRDYYDIAAVGYGAGGVRSLLSPRGEFARPSKLAARAPRRVMTAVERTLPDGRSVMAAVERNSWIEAVSAGDTPMCGALEEAALMAELWRRRNPASYPLTVINITDGEATDGGDDRVSELAQRIRATGAILMNICIARAGGAVIFPESVDQLPTHRFARLLWDASSWMPENYQADIRSIKQGAGAGPFRAMGWGCHIASVAAMMNIGSVNSVML